MTRTDNDTSDLATSVGATATTVAAGWARAYIDAFFAEALGFRGERNDAATYLERHGWRAVRTPLNRRLADNGLPLQRTDPGAPFAENYYCAAILPEAQRAAR